MDDGKVFSQEFCAVSFCLHKHSFNVTIKCFYAGQRRRRRLKLLWTQIFSRSINFLFSFVVMSFLCLTIAMFLFHKDKQDIAMCAVKMSPFRTIYEKIAEILGLGADHSAAFYFSENIVWWFHSWLQFNCWGCIFLNSIKIKILIFRWNKIKSLSWFKK